MVGRHKFFNLHFKIQFFKLKSQVTTNTTRDINGTEILGCPSTQEWCRTTPQMTVTQFLLGYGFTSVGYPVGVTLVQTIFSKVLGPRPQGLWMGIMTGAGCGSRVLGPVFVGLIYTRFGTYHTFGITGATLIIAMVWLQLVYKRLIPQIVVSKENHQDENVPKLEVQIPLVLGDSVHDASQKEIEMQNMNGSMIRNKDWHFILISACKYLLKKKKKKARYSIESLSYILQLFHHFKIENPSFNREYYSCTYLYNKSVQTNSITV